MAKRHKDYRVAPPVSSLLTEPGSFLVNMASPDGTCETYDFAIYEARPQMAAELSIAFRHHLAACATATRVNVFRAVTSWFTFLDAHQSNVAAMRDVDGAVLRQFITWLENRFGTKGTRYVIWSGIKQLFSWLQRNRPLLVQADLELPFNAFPRKNKEARQREALSRTEMDAVLAAARSDIERSWATFTEGQGLIDEATTETTSAGCEIGSSDLGNLLAVLVNRFGSLVPTHREICEKRLQPLFLAHGGAYRISQYLHALAETLIPYMIIIGAETYANPEALRMLRRDCMSEHLLLDSRVMVRWEKGRATREQQRSFLRNGSFSVPKLIERVLAMTAPLVPHVAPSERDKLFLIGTIQGSPRGAKLISKALTGLYIRRFVQRHGLRADTGEPLRLTFASLRPTGLTLAHQHLGHDIMKTQVLANHASPDTTQRYVDRPVVRRAQVAAIGVLQTRFVDAVRNNAQRGATIPAQAVATRYATAAGFRCLDPMSGVAEGQKAGQICTAWLGCFTCPNAVIPLETAVLARLMRTKDALIEARARMDPDRWRVLYAPKLEIIEHDILPRFASELHAEAVCHSEYTAPIPLIE